MLFWAIFFGGPPNGNPEKEMRKMAWRGTSRGERGELPTKAPAKMMDQIHEWFGLWQPWKDWLDSSDFRCGYRLVFLLCVYDIFVVCSGVWLNFDCSFFFLLSHRARVALVVKYVWSYTIFWMIYPAATVRIDFFFEICYYFSPFLMFHHADGF